MSLIPVRIKIRPMPDAVPESARSKRRRLRRTRRRTIVYIVAGAAALLILPPLALWAHYRYTYVVSVNALVKGHMTEVGAQLDGVVTSVEVDAGQPVKAGQVLARFEDHQLQASVARAQSQLDRATRELEVERLAIVQERRRLSSVVTEASARLAAAKSQAEAADSQADDAKNRFQLRQSMEQGGLIPKEELRIADSARRTATALGATAQADHKAAAAAKRLAEVESEGLQVRERHIDVLESEVAGSRAELSLAEADLRAAVIRAPEDGWVVRRIVESGGSVVVGQPITSLWIGKDVWVEAWIDEDDLSKVQAGSDAKVTLKSFPNRVFAGVVETVGVSTDYELPDAALPEPRHSRMRAAPLVCARIRLENPEGLLPGLSAVVGIRKGKASQPH